MFTVRTSRTEITINRRCVTMTTSYRKRRNRKILALLLSSFMLAAAGTLTACGGGTDSSTDDTEQTYTEPDNARIQNGSFEFFDDGKGKTIPPPRARRPRPARRAAS